MANIFITGGTGFIGKSLVKKLYELGHNLKLLIRETSNIEPFQTLKKIEYIKGDVRDIDCIKQAIQDIDVIYHLAANTQIWAKKKSSYDDINIVGSENIAKVALESRIKLIYISSFFAIGPYMIGEDIPDFETYERKIKCFMDYERTKYLSAKLIKSYKEKGLNVIIFYPGFVYGPGDLNFYGKLTIDIISETLLGIPKSSVSQFSMAYIYDIINPMINVMDRDDLMGEEFFIGGETVSTLDYLNLIAEIADVKKPRQVPNWMAMLYGLMCETKAKLGNKVPYMTRALIKMARYHWAYSSEKAIKKLNYTITPLREGLKSTVAWYKEYIKNQSEIKKK